MTARLTLLQGLPAAGKSTEAERLAAATGAHRLGLDAIRFELWRETPRAAWAPGREAEARAELAARLVRLLSAGRRVIVEDTHVDPAQVAHLRRALHGRYVPVDVRRLATPPAECIRRDAARPHPIGAACIRDLAARQAAAEAAGWQLTGRWLTGRGA